MQTIQYLFGVEAIRRKFARRVDTSTPKVYGNKKVAGSSYLGGQVLTQTVADGKGGVVTIQKPIAFVRKAGRSMLAVSQAATLQRTYFARGLEWYLSAKADLMNISANKTTFQSMVLNPKLHYAFDNGTDLRAAGYNFFGFLRAYGIKYTAAHEGVAPSSTLLPTPVQ